MGLFVVFWVSGHGIRQECSSNATSVQFVDHLAYLKAFPAVAQHAACYKIVIHAADVLCIFCEPSLNVC